jgi:alpha-N-arabinofuranosidase
LRIKSNDYVYKGKKLPAVSASASKDSLGRTHVSLVNIDPNKSQDITVNLGTNYTSLTGRILTSGKLQDHNTFDNPNKVKPATFNGASLKGNTLTVKLPPFSVVVLEMK